MGTTPDSIHVVAIMAIQISIGTAGSICEPLLDNPVRMPLNVNAPVAEARIRPTKDEPSKTTGDHRFIASAPSNAIITIKLTRSNTMGESDAHRGARLGADTVVIYIINLQ